MIKYNLNVTLVVLKIKNTLLAKRFSSLWGRRMLSSDTKGVNVPASLSPLSHFQVLRQLGVSGEAVHVHLVEISPYMRDMQRRALCGGEVGWSM